MYPYAALASRDELQGLVEFHGEFGMTCSRIMLITARECTSGLKILFKRRRARKLEAGGHTDAVQVQVPRQKIQAGAGDANCAAQLSILQCGNFGWHLLAELLLF